MKINAKYFRLITTIFCLSFLCVFGNIRVVYAKDAPALSQHEAKVFNGAYKEYGKGNNIKVLAILHKYVIENKKTHPFAYILYGLASTALKQPEKAIVAYMKGLAHYPDNYNLKHNYALALMHNQQFNKAAGLFLEIIPQSPKNQQASIRYLAAQNYFSAKQYTRAAQVAEVLLQVKRPAKKHIRFVAISYMKATLWKQADTYFTMLADHFPTDFHAWNALASIRLQRNNPAGAAVALELVNRIIPKHERVQSTKRNLSSIYSGLKASRLELLALNALPRTKTRKEQYIQALINAGNSKETLKYLEQQISQKPSAELYFIKGSVEYRLLHIEKAQKSFASGAQFKGKDAEKCLLLLALVAWEEGDRKNATQYFKRIPESSQYANHARHALKSLEILEKEALLATVLEDEKEGKLIALPLQ